MKLLSRGAEAEIYFAENKIIKKRQKKSYRHEKLDFVLRRKRTRREAKIIKKIPVNKPKLISVDEENMILEMSYIEGKKLRDVLEKNLSICKELGREIAKIHNSGIIHGDLTTSNLILDRGKIYFIDFGLSFFSHKIEDKAVDLHLLKQALKSKHYKIFKKAFSLVLKGYKEVSHNFEEIINRLEKVEARGRYKGKN